VSVTAAERRGLWGPVKSPDKRFQVWWCSPEGDEAGTVRWAIRPFQVVRDGRTWTQERVGEDGVWRYVTRQAGQGPVWRVVTLIGPGESRREARVSEVTERLPGGWVLWTVCGDDGRPQYRHG